MEGQRSYDHHVVDVELTNRCNADCTFCPRSRTPHQGMMSPDVFEQALVRVAELRAIAHHLFATPVRLSFCGLGEQLLHRHVAEYVRRGVEEGFAPSICSNAALLDDELTHSLVDAGLDSIFVNFAELGEEYDRVYDLSFERTVANIERFVEIAGDRCEVHIVLVDHRNDPERMLAVEQFWRDHGVNHFFPSPMLNRSGSLVVPGMEFAGGPEEDRARAIFAEHGVTPICAAPFAYPFIGYDGTYYLCSSDWEKRVPLGTVFESPILDATARRYDRVHSREPICRSCNHDPINHLGLMVRDVEDGRASEGDLAIGATMLVEAVRDVESMIAGYTAAGLIESFPLGGPAPETPKRIPVRVA